MEMKCVTSVVRDAGKANKIEALQSLFSVSHKMATLTAEARLAEARELIEIAKKELQEAEIQVMRKDRQLMNARSNLRSVEAEILAEPSSFKQITDAIQVIQLYAIRNGISLGSTVDALTEKLAAGS